MILAAIAPVELLLAQGPCQFTVTADVTDVTCFGESDGAIVLDLSEPTGNLDIAWAGIPTAVDNVALEDLEAGEYSAIITDVNGCTDVFTFEVQQPEELLAFGHQRAICQGLSVALLDSITGGTGQYSISWTNNAGFNCMNCGNNVSATQTNQYIVTVTDQNGCTATQFIGVSVSDPIVANIEVIADTCGGTGIIIINAEGGSGELTYTVGGQTSGDSIFTGFQGGDIVDIFIHDTTGCFFTETVVIPSAVLDPQEEFNVSDISCPGAGDGIIEVIAEETVVVGYALDDPNNIDGTTTIFEDVQGGPHIIYIEDANGCITEHPVTVLDPVAPLLAASISDCSCFESNDGVLTSNALGGSFNIDFFHIDGNPLTQNDGIFTDLPSGDYTVIATDVNGCEFEQLLTVGQPPEIIEAATVVDCNCSDSEDGSILMDVSGGTGTFDFSRNGLNFFSDPLFNELAPGDYLITMRDSTGCTKTREVTVTAPDTLQLASDITHATCPGEASGKIVIIVSGGTAVYEYKLDNGAFDSENTFPDLHAGFYEIATKDANGCEKSQFVEVLESETPQTEINSIDATCPENPDGKIVIIVSGGTQVYSYSLNGTVYQSIPLFENLMAGLYDVFLKNDSNCVFTSQKEVGSGPGMILDIETASWAEAALIDLTVYGGVPPYTYIWSNGEFTEDIYVDDNGDYIVIVSDGNGCTDTDTANVIRVTINDLLLERGFTVYPNPSSGYIEIDVSETNMEIDRVTIMDARGRTVRTRLWQEGSRTTTIDISDLATGNYQVALECADKVRLMRLVKTGR